MFVIFPGSNVLESRIASMLPNLAKNSSSIGSHAPVVIDLQDTPEDSPEPEPMPEEREPIPDYVPPKPVREEVQDDRSSTPVQDEPDEKSPSPPPPSKTPPISKPPVTKTKTNPIDFLSQLLTKTSNSSSSSNFLQSLSLLTNTVKSQYQKKRDSEEDGSNETSPVAPPPVPTSSMERSSGYAGVHSPETPPTSGWSPWKSVAQPPPPQPTLSQAEPPISLGRQSGVFTVCSTGETPVLHTVKSPDTILRPPLPQHPPLPPEPFPIQPPSPQNFPPVSQSVPYGQPPPSLPPRPILQPRPNLQPFTPTNKSPPAFPGPPVNPQSFAGQTSGSSTSPGAAVPPIRTGFNPLFPFGPVHRPPPSVPPPPQPVEAAQRPPAPHFQSQNSWEQPRVEPVSPASQTYTNVSGPPPPWSQSSPLVSQPGDGGYGNTIHTLASRRPSWERQGNFARRDPKWNRDIAGSDGGSAGYAHPWNQPQNYGDDDDESDIVQAMPPKPLPPAPKSILRNRSSSLREVVLVDESDGDQPGPNETVAHVPPPSAAPEAKPVGILRKPPIDGGRMWGGNSGSDVQSEFIAKLKQKSGSNVSMPVPPPGGRQLTSVSLEEEEDVADIDPLDIHGPEDPGADEPDAHSSGEPISTIGVIGSNGRTASVKSDDMDLDSDDHESNIEAKSETSWENTDEQLWQEERQELVPRKYPHEGSVEVPMEPEQYEPSRGHMNLGEQGSSAPSRSYGYDTFQPQEVTQSHRPVRFRDQFSGGPQRGPYHHHSHQPRPRMPYYRY